MIVGKVNARIVNALRRPDHPTMVLHSSLHFLLKRMIKFFPTSSSFEILDYFKEIRSK
jgi:hypothetical protein